MEEEAEQIALIDMDGTLVDYEGELLRRLESLRSPNEPPIGIHDNVPDWLGERIRLIKTHPGFWSDLPVLEDGMKIYRKLREIGFEVHVLTKGPKTTTNAWTEKLIWCQKYLHQDQEITITFNKGLVYGKVLVDDYPPYVKSWLRFRPRGLVIMPARPYNEGVSHPSVVRYTGQNWDPVARRLEEAFRRRPRESLAAVEGFIPDTPSW